MEFLNQIEIKGVVGRVNAQKIGEATVTNFSVLTEYAYGNKNKRTIETTWFNCNFYGEVPIESGDNVHLMGRMRQRSYDDADGVERYVWDVVVQKVEKL